MTNSEWGELQQDREVRAWVRFLGRLDLAPAIFVSLVRIAFRWDRL